MFCLSCVFFAFNLLLLGCGAAISGIGIWTVTDPTVLQKYINLPVDQLLVVSYVALAIGGMLVIIGLVGCCGAAASNPCILCVFSMVLGFLLVAGITVGVVAYVAATNKSFGEKVKNVMFKQLKNLDAMGKVEKNLKCCGVTGPKDYKNATIPTSCKNEAGILYTEGCWQRIKDVLVKKVHILGGMTGTLAVLGIITLVLSIVMICSVKSSKVV